MRRKWFKAMWPLEGEQDCHHAKERKYSTQEGTGGDAGLINSAPSLNILYAPGLQRGVTTILNLSPFENHAPIVFPILMMRKLRSQC